MVLHSDWPLTIATLLLVGVAIVGLIRHSSCNVEVESDAEHVV